MLYSLVDHKTGRNIKKFHLLGGCVFCLFAIFFVLGGPLIFLSNIENVYLYNFFLTWSFLPIIALPIIPLVTVKKNNRSMNSSRWDSTPEQLSADLTKRKLKSGGISGGAIGVMVLFLSQTVDQDIFAAMILVLGVVMGVASFSFACKHFHAAYVIGKYAPYFKDERLRGPTE